MSRIYIKRNHQLGQQKCQELAEKITDKLIAQIGGSKTIRGNSIQYRHISGSKGELVSGEDTLTVEVKLSLLARSFAPSIEAEINEACDKYLD
ncbi:hypothetical protein HBA55_30060 [Pseudomaricurvus alkylphenolicus]|uniref:polyhydroxyalkanoic acid system family protein n=1 Tax=Pseudomaricurvus alkylphenolicus TaxID=1306991 RepID=UPI00141E6CC9|nr:hypothetical protein [Pseudomaricurvus alkylphenolicus]